MKNDHPVRITLCLLGFSLLELMVVIVLIALLIMIAVPSIRALGGLDLKNEVTKVAGLASEVYALAAISGKTHRIVFDLDNRKYWVEEKVGDAGEIKPELGYEELMKARFIKGEDDKDATNEFLPTFKAVEGHLSDKIELQKDTVIYGAWTEQMAEIARSGQVSIYFFSGGYTQSSFVSLAIKGEEERSAIYVALSPLTGAIKIDLGEPDTKDLLVVESEQ